MESIFQSWIFWILLIIFFLIIFSRPAAKPVTKWDREKKILGENGYFGINLDKDHRLSGSPLFHCYSDYYQKAFDIIFFDNQESITINGEEYIFKRNIKAVKIFEKITHRRFCLENDFDLYILIYSLLLANNESMTLRIDDFLSYAQKSERNCSNSENAKNKQKRHIPAILLENIKKPGREKNESTF